jgi:hypothetical protein
MMMNHGRGRTAARWLPALVSILTGSLVFAAASPASAQRTSPQTPAPPNRPATLVTDPGGSCAPSPRKPAQIGNDDVTFEAYVSDSTQTTPLTTKYVIHNASGQAVYNSATQGTSVSTGNDTTAQTTLTQSQMQALGANGSVYHWYAQTKNRDGQSSPASQTCFFSYSTASPAAPAVKVPSSGTFGTRVPAAFTESAGCGSTASPCPASYTYQLGDSVPVSVIAHKGSWSGEITVTQEGPLTLSVYGTAADGNPSQATTARLVGTAPSPPYPDGYFAGGSYPSLLVVGGSSTPGLWLSPGTGDGTVGPRINIGKAGTGINSVGSPSDWDGVIAVHGDFLGRGVQDVLAYYPSGPSQGVGVIIGGEGNKSPLLPISGNTTDVGGLGNNPAELVGAGDASQQAGCIQDPGSCLDDLIGIASDGTSDELYLYVNEGAQGAYAPPASLSTAAPDPSDLNWSHYALATAQMGDNPLDTVLFALDKTNGTLWESVNPNAGNATTGPTTIIGTGNWTQITVPWGAKPPTLVQGDINQAGATELWTRSGGTLTSYTLSGATLTQEASQPYK